MMVYRDNRLLLQSSLHDFTSAHASAFESAPLIRDVDSGAELRYQTADAALVSALHAWFDAQLSDHGTDARAGQQQHHGSMSRQTP